MKQWTLKKCFKRIKRDENKRTNISTYLNFLCSFSFQALIIVIALHIFVDKREKKIWNFYLIISRSHLRMPRMRDSLATDQTLPFVAWYFFFKEKYLFGFSICHNHHHHHHPIRRCNWKWSYLVLTAHTSSNKLAFICAHSVCSECERWWQKTTTKN